MHGNCLVVSQAQVRRRGVFFYFVLCTLYHAGELAAAPGAPGDAKKMRRAANNGAAKSD
jgi:hypothetical protein